MDTERRLWLHGLRVGDRVAVCPSGLTHSVDKVTRCRIYIGSRADAYDRDTGEGVTFWTKGTSLAPAPPQREGR